MNKILTLGLLSAMAAPAMAGDPAVKLNEPRVIENVLIMNISPDGHYGVSVTDEGMILFDFEAGTTEFYMGDNDVDLYTCGLGNAFSKTGVFVGSTTYTGTASYWENGEWHNLPVPNPAFTNLAHGISADGNVICGIVGNSGDLTEEASMRDLPAVWTRGADGKFGDPVILPCPIKDFTGRTPQLVSAMNVSDDGRTVVGQVWDYSGFCITPIIFTCDDNGTWSYNDFGSRMANPKERVFPQYPADLPNPPTPEDFMTPEEKAEYEEALAEWNEVGDGDYSTYPEPGDYMSRESIGAYNEAAGEWNAKAEVFNEQLKAFNEVFLQVIDEGMFFVRNNILMTPDGTKFTSTRQFTVEDETAFDGVRTVNAPYLFTVNPEGEGDDIVSYKKLGEGKLVSSITEDGSVFASGYDDFTPPTAYVAPYGKNEFEDAVEYIASRNQSIGEWLKKEMTHDVTVSDMNGASSTDTMLVSGQAYCSSDARFFSFCTENYWDFSTTAPYYYDYVFDINTSASAVSLIDADTAAGRFTVVSLDGKVLMHKVPVARLRELTPGLYIINGRKSVVK